MVTEGAPPEVDGGVVIAVTVVAVGAVVDGWLVMAVTVVVVGAAVDGALVIVSTVTAVPPLESIALALEVEANCVVKADCTLAASDGVVAIDAVMTVLVPAAAKVRVTVETGTPSVVATDCASSACCVAS